MFELRLSNGCDSVGYDFSKPLGDLGILLRQILRHLLCLDLEDANMNFLNDFRLDFLFSLFVELDFLLDFFDVF